MMRSSFGRENPRTQRATESIPISSQLASIFHANASSKSGEKIFLTENDVTHKLFPDAPEVGHLVFNYLKGSQSQDGQGIDLDKFQSRGGQLLAQSADFRLPDFYFNVFAAEKSEITKSSGQTMLYECHHIDWMNLGVSVQSSPRDRPDRVLDAIVNSLFKGGADVNRDKLLKWCASCCPKMFNGLHSNICSRLTEERGATSGASVLPPAGGKSVLYSCKGGTSIATLSIVWQLSCFLPAVYFPNIAGYTAPSTNLPIAVHPSGWQVVYYSDSHGLSTNRFLHHVMDYKGCTVLLISCDKFIFVAAIDTDWRQSSQSWGGINCSLMMFQPDFNIVTSGSGIVYFNISDRTAPKGIVLGKNVVKVDGDFEKVNFYGVDYRLKAIEVWGCGGISAHDAQIKQKAWEQQDIHREQNRKLVPEEWKNNTDRQLLEMAGITTDHNQRSDI